MSHQVCISLKSCKEFDYEMFDNQVMKEIKMVIKKYGYRYVWRVNGDYVEEILSENEEL